MPYSEAPIAQTSLPQTLAQRALAFIMSIYNHPTTQTARQQAGRMGQNIWAYLKSAAQEHTPPRVKDAVQTGLQLAQNFWQHPWTKTVSTNAGAVFKFSSKVFKLLCLPFLYLWLILPQQVRLFLISITGGVVGLAALGTALIHDSANTTKALDTTSTITRADAAYAFFVPPETKQPAAIPAKGTGIAEAILSTSAPDPLLACRNLANTNPTVAAMRQDPTLAARVLECRNVTAAHAAQIKAERAAFVTSTRSECQLEANRLQGLIDDGKPIDVIYNQSLCKRVNYLRLTKFVPIFEAQQRAAELAGQTPPPPTDENAPTPNGAPLVVPDQLSDNPNDQYFPTTPGPAAKPSATTSHRSTSPASYSAPPVPPAINAPTPAPALIIPSTTPKPTANSTQAPTPQLPKAPSPPVIKLE